MSNKHLFTNTAIAALAGLTLAATSSTTLAGVATTGATNAGQAPVTKGEIESTPLVLEAEDGANSNDTFENSLMLDAPTPALFAIKAELSKSESDGQCRDADYFMIKGLNFLGDHRITLGGEIRDDMKVVWVDRLDGSVIRTSVEGVLEIVADDNEEAWILCTSNTDAAEGEGPKPHGLCGSYNLVVEAFGFGADVNGDSLVDINDVRLMLTLIGSVDSPKADLNHDGIVDAADLRMLADAVTDNRARGLAEKKAKKLEQRQIRAERKAAKQALKAARKAERAARRR